MSAPSTDQLRLILQAYRLDDPFTIRRAGGTASPKYEVRTPRGRYLLRVRPGEFSDEAVIGFDHQLLARLHAARLPVPRPLPTGNGATWLRRDQDVYELLSWIEGEPFAWADEELLQGLGVFLTCFHETLADPLPVGKEGWLREDHPERLKDYPAALGPLVGSKRQEAALAQVADQLALVREQLDSGLYASLPRAVVHGDLHPGNVGFADGRVAALYDFDYTSVQARLRDVCDGLMFFAARRDQPLQAEQIHSLTAPFEPDAQRSITFLRGYQRDHPLTDTEWMALPLLIRSRWIQIRLRGSRKVADAEKVSFVLNRFFEPINWLDHQAEAFFQFTRKGLSA